jgi:hypothetical protein
MGALLTFFHVGQQIVNQLAFGVVLYVGSQVTLHLIQAYHFGAEFNERLVARYVFRGMKLFQNLGRHGPDIIDLVLQGVDAKAVEGRVNGRAVAGLLPQAAAKCQQVLRNHRLAALQPGLCLRDRRKAEQLAVGEL